MKRPTRHRRAGRPHAEAPSYERGAPAPVEPAAPTAPDRAIDPRAATLQGGRGQQDKPLFAGRYRLGRQLGRGGMGSVYLANQVAVNRNVAIKLLENASNDEVIVNRFKREARVIAKLQHPHIVNLYDFGTDPTGQLYLVMEYIDGDSLKGLISREAPLEPSRVCEIGFQILDALAPAHAQNIIHRDLKPDNVMLATVPGRRDFVKLLDFGIAKVKRADPGADNTIQTTAGLIVGSLRYISPEQVDTKEITTRTDMYSLGVILYELLTGQPLFDYASPADCAIAHLTEPAKPPRLDGRELRGPLVDFIMACLDKDPAGRPEGAEAGLKRLRACRERPLAEDVAPTETARRAFSGGDKVTVEERSVQASETIQQIPAVPKAPAAPETPPTPAPTVSAKAVEAGLFPKPASRRGAGPRMTDCALDTARKLHESGARAASHPDIALAHRQGARSPGSGMKPIPARPPTMEQPAPPPARTNPLLVLLALVGLAAIGAAVYVLVIHPATQPDPEPPQDTPAVVEPVEK